MSGNGLMGVLRDYTAAVAEGKVTLANYVSVITGTGILLFLTADTAYALAFQAIGGIIWLNIAYFIWEWAVRLRHAARERELRAYIFSGMGVVDAVSAIAIPLAILFGVEPRTAFLLGIIWLLKIAPDFAGFKQLRRVLLQEKEQLGSVLIIFGLVLYAASVIVHVLERDAQPAIFGTIHGTLWWAIVTLTTTGYGDAVPVTPLGRIVAACVMICGIGVLGMLVGVLATGYAAEARRAHFIRTWELVSKVPFFANLAHGAVVDVTNMLRRLDLPPRAIVMRKGAAGDCMYFIASGEVAVELPDRKVTLTAGSFVGELALLGNAPRTATVVTTTDTELLVLDLLDFRTLLGKHPDLAEAIDTEAKRRIRENLERGRGDSE
jgi:voltage-gated potassium channel